jgi:hypothetical protein
VDTTGLEISEYYGEYKCVSSVSSHGEALQPNAIRRRNENADEDFVIYNLIKLPSKLLL